MKRRPPVPLLIFLILTLYPLNLLYSLLLGEENILFSYILFLYSILGLLSILCVKLIWID